MNRFMDAVLQANVIAIAIVGSLLPGMFASVECRSFRVVVCLSIIKDAPNMFVPVAWPSCDQIYIVYILPQRKTNCWTLQLASNCRPNCATDLIDANMR